jgi:purine nucleosidase
MGGAVWCKGNVTPHAEFNFYRDPGAAAAVLAAGLPVTVVPLDVTRQVALDESHVAQLSRAGTRAGDLLAEMIRFPLEAEGDAAHGSFLVHDALALGAVIWPPLFMRAQMALEVVVAGEQAGRSKPLVAKDKSRQIGVSCRSRGSTSSRTCWSGCVTRVSWSELPCGCELSWAIAMFVFGR